MTTTELIHIVIEMDPRDFDSFSGCDKFTQFAIELNHLISIQQFTRRNALACFDLAVKDLRIGMIKALKTV